MSVTYRFPTTASFYREAFRRYGQQVPHRRRNRWISVLGLAFITAVWFYAVSSAAPWRGLPEFALIVSITTALVSTVVAPILFVVRVRKLPGINSEITTVLDEVGLSAVGPHEEVKLAWSGVTRAARLPDGMIIARGRVFRWLPDSALVDATPAEATDFVRSRCDLIDMT